MFRLPLAHISTSTKNEKQVDPSTVFGVLREWCSPRTRRACASGLEREVRASVRHRKKRCSSIGQEAPRTSRPGDGRKTNHHTHDRGAKSRLLLQYRGKLRYFFKNKLKKFTQKPRPSACPPATGGRTLPDPHRSGPRPRTIWACRLHRLC